MLLAVLAIVLVAAFGLLARNNAVGTAAAERIVNSSNPTAAEWDKELDAMRSAELLDPSSDWELTRANFLLLRDKRAAIEVAESVARREPDNLSAWWVILRGARGLDRARWREAVVQVRRLNPPQ
jgi:hypothetical protein